MTKRVFSDAGHGGSDPGAVDGKRNDPVYSEEKDYALDIDARYVSGLKRCGIDVRRSRTGDTYPTLTQRSNAANAFDADVSVSHHCNALSDGASARGIEVLYKSEAGKRLAECIYSFLDDVSPWADRGLVHRDNLHMLNATGMPAVIVEYGFVTNTQEEAALASSTYRMVLAEACVKGTCKYLGVAYVPASGGAYAPPTTPAREFVWVDTAVGSPTPKAELKAKASQLSVKMVVRSGGYGKALSSLHCDTATDLPDLLAWLGKSKVVYADEQTVVVWPSSSDGSVRRLNLPTDTSL